MQAPISLDPIESIGIVAGTGSGIQPFSPRGAAVLRRLRALEALKRIRKDGRSEMCYLSKSASKWFPVVTSNVPISWQLGPFLRSSGLMG